MVRDERPVATVPRTVLACLACALLAQALWQGAQPPPDARARALPSPPSVTVLRALSFGEPVTGAKALMLWLQAFDNQPGISIPFRELDFDRVAAWLDRILALDPRAQYPLLAAARVYGEVNDVDKQRRMMQFVYERFRADPNRRWPWLAHAVFVAKHRMHDLPLALEYARALAAETTPGQVPDWARQMQIFVLEDMGDLEAARVLLGGLIAAGEARDPAALAFLKWRLTQLGKGAE